MTGERSFRKETCNNENATQNVKMTLRYDNITRQWKSRVLSLDETTKTEDCVTSLGVPLSPLRC